MARKCSICTHPKQGDIDAAIVAGNDSIRSIAKLFEVSDASLLRHSKNHIAKALTESKKAQVETNADNLFEKIEQLMREVSEIKTKAMVLGNLQLALTAIDKQARVIELYGKMKGMLKDFEVNVGVQVNIGEVMGVTWTYLSKNHPKVARELREHMAGIYDVKYTVE